jgi:hypothetical protein
MNTKYRYDNDLKKGKRAFFNECGFESGSSISSESGSRVKTKNLEGIQQKILLIFFDQKIEIYLSLSLHKGLQATGEDFSPQKRTSSTSKHEIYELFSIFCKSFLPFWIRKRNKLLLREFKIPPALKLPSDGL